MVALLRSLANFSVVLGATATVDAEHVRQSGDTCNHHNKIISKGAEPDAGESAWNCQHEVTETPAVDPAPAEVPIENCAASPDSPAAAAPAGNRFSVPQSAKFKATTGAAQGLMTAMKEDAHAMKEDAHAMKEDAQTAYSNSKLKDKYPRQRWFFLFAFICAVIASLCFLYVFVANDAQDFEPDDYHNFRGAFWILVAVTIIGFLVLVGVYCLTRNGLIDNMLDSELEWLHKPLRMFVDLIFVLSAIWGTLYAIACVYTLHTYDFDAETPGI